MEQEFFQAVANYGFPAIICLYLLIRIEGKMEKLSVSISELNKSITLLANNSCRNEK